MCHAFFEAQVASVIRRSGLSLPDIEVVDALGPKGELLIKIGDRGFCTKFGSIPEKRIIEYVKTLDI